MPKAKVKIIKATSEDPDIAEIFNDMMNGNIKIDIVHKKYVKIENSIRRYLAAVSFIENTCESICSRCGIAGVIENLRSFCAEFSGLVERSFNAEDLNVYVKHALNEPEAYRQIPKINKEQYIEVYKRVKSCDVVNSVIITLKTLNIKKLNFMYHDKTIKSKNAVFKKKELKDMTGAYILKHPDVIFAPIDGLNSLNVKHLFINALQDEKDIILLWIQKVYEICMDLYNAINIPDIDPDDFVQVVLSSIDQVKKRIPRCNRAFDKIKDSIELLKTNFNGYYQGYVDSNNPTIIIESFIQDVSQQSGNDPELAREFKQIINFYKNMVQQNKGSNPQLDKLFSKVGKQFDVLSGLTGEKFDDVEAEATYDEPCEASAAEAAEVETLDPDVVNDLQKNFMSMLGGDGDDLDDDVEEETM